ncbi:hypothetical protein [Qipengyuania flava]|uniref:hypothetical protein n=1 Tax=Qipengyuania flava TaxID=192812 RepID=UPI001C63B287|nr:hypothetical protein [Qipengyuania flava]QYJ07001.1 hypothetical protein KUV82_13310 [Qipengyuania flava]
MHKEGEEIHVTDTEASGGSKEGVVRWVLAGGLVLAVILMSLVWIIPALSTDAVDEEGTVSGQIMQEQEGGDGTDSIVGVPDEEILTDESATIPESAQPQTPETEAEMDGTEN